MRPGIRRQHTPSGERYVSVEPGWAALSALGGLLFTVGAVGEWGVWLGLFLTGALVVALSWMSVAVFLYVAVNSPRPPREQPGDGD